MPLPMNRALARALADALRVPAYALKLGAAYGVRVRLPHALVMTALFGKHASSPGNVLARSVALAFEHGKNLAYFAFIYKAALAVLRVQAIAWHGGVAALPGTPAAPWHAIVAAAVGARLVWSRYSSVNYQIVMYLLSRVLIGVFRLLAKKGVQPMAALEFKQVYPVLAICTWAAVMWLYETDPSVLHPSLTASMNDIYGAANSAASTIGAAVGVSSAASAVSSSIPLSEYLPTWPTLFVLMHAIYSAGSEWRRLFALPAEGAS